MFYLISKGMPRRYNVQAQGSDFSEKEVEGLLKKSHYQILSKRTKEAVITNVDGKDHFGYLEADYLVRKNKKTYVVIVKTGEEVVDPNEPTFRRKLLEYDSVFAPDGLLLLDLAQGEIHEINFRFPHERDVDFFFRFLIALFIILMVIGIIWLMVAVKLF